jgi:hypothetical protein
LETNSHIINGQPGFADSLRKASLMHILYFFKISIGDASRSEPAKPGRTFENAASYGNLQNII